MRRLGIDLDIEYRITYSEGTELVNLAANESRILRNTFEVGVENRVKDRFDVELTADFSFNDVEYSLNRELDRNYVNSQYPRGGHLLPRRLDPGVGLPLPHLRPGDSSRNHGTSPGGDAALMRRVLDDRAEIELRAYDLLNQNQGVAVTNSGQFH